MINQNLKRKESWIKTNQQWRSMIFQIRYAIMIGDVISFDDVISFQAIKQKNNLHCQMF